MSTHVGVWPRDAPEACQVRGPERSFVQRIGMFRSLDSVERAPNRERKGRELQRPRGRTRAQARMKGPPSAGRQEPFGPAIPLCSRQPSIRVAVAERVLPELHEAIARAAHNVLGSLLRSWSRTDS